VKRLSARRYADNSSILPTHLLGRLIRFDAMEADWSPGPEPPHGIGRDSRLGCNFALWVQGAAIGANGLVGIWCQHLG
jgi:hypothetical protein